MLVSREDRKKNTLLNPSSCAKIHLLHACEITPTQATPDSGRSPRLTFWNRAMESASSSSPSGREAERYRTTGNGWWSETVQDRTQTLIQAPVAQRRRPSLWHTYPQVALPHQTHLTGTCCLLGLLEAQGCVWECVCVLIKHSRPLGALVTCSSPLCFFLSVCEIKELIHSLIFNCLLPSLSHP